MAARRHAVELSHAIEEAIRAVAPDEVYTWATYQGAELDLLMLKHGRRLGIEAKRTDAPRLTRSMQIAQRDLALERIEAVPLAAVAEGLPGIFPPGRRTSHGVRP